MEKITSASNPLVKRLRGLAEAKNRKKERAFPVEGEVMIDEALKSGLVPLFGLFEHASPLIETLLSAGASIKLCDRAAIESACDTKTPQGCCVAFTLPENGEVPKDARRLIALDDVQDPGNLGTILRTADAAGFEGALLGERCADPYSPKVQRAAMGSGFRVKTQRVNLPEALKEQRAHGAKIVISALDGTDLYSHAPFLADDRLILVIGNEARGVSDEVTRLADISLKIPMRGRAESLNAAVAAGILMYELTKQA